MAESSEQLDFVIRLLFPDAKVPPIDTKEAEAAIARLRQVVTEAQRATAGSASAMVNSVASPMAAAAAAMPATTGYGFNSPYTMSRGPGGGAVFTYPTLTTSPVPSRGAYPWPAGPGFASGGSGVQWANNAPGPGNWSMGNGNWSQGPIRDPGSWAQSSLQTGRGYDQAMLRQHVEGLNFSGIEQGAERITRSLIKAREASIGLAASLVLLNKSQEQGSGWDNWYTQGTAALGIGSYGSRLAGSAADLVRGGAGLGSGALAAASAASGTGMIGRSAAWGARALGGLAGVSSFTVGAPIAAAAALFGARSYYNYQGQQSLNSIAGLESQNAAINENRRLMGLMAPSNAMGAFASQMGIGAAADFMRFQGGGISSFGLGAENRRRLQGLGVAEGVARSQMNNLTGTGDEPARLNAANQLKGILEQTLHIEQQSAQARQQSLQTQLQQVQAAQQQREAERETANSISGGVGRVNERDWRRGRAAYDRIQQGGFNERDARILDGIPGWGGKLDEWFRERGQGRVDAMPEGWREEGARTSSQMQALRAEIEKLKQEESRTINEMKNLSSTFAETFKALTSEMFTLQTWIREEMGRRNNQPR